MARVRSFALCDSCQVSAKSWGETSCRYCEMMTEEKASAKEKRRLPQRHAGFKFVYGTKAIPRSKLLLTACRG